MLKAFATGGIPGRKRQRCAHPADLTFSILCCIIYQIQYIYRNGKYTHYSKYTQGLSIACEVKKTMKQGTKIPDWLLRFLRSLQEIEVHTLDDGTISLTVAGGNTHNFKVEARSRIGEKEALHLVNRYSHQQTSRQYPLLICTRRLSSNTRDVLRDAGISWVEHDTGVIHLIAPGLLIHQIYENVPFIMQHAAVQGSGRATRLVGQSGIVAETLLLRYLGQPIKVMQVAAEAGVSAGLTSRILKRLEIEGILRTEGKGPSKHRYLIDPGKLLEIWAAEETTAVDKKTELYVWTSTPDELYGNLKALESAGITSALSGVAAANSYTPTLTTIPWPELWVAARTAPAEVADVFQGEIVDDGANITIRQKAGDAALHHAQIITDTSAGLLIPLSGVPVISRPRAYIEAFRESKRSREVAENLRERLGY